MYSMPPWRSDNMRRTIPILFLILFIGGAVAQTPSLPHRVYGNVTDGGSGVGCLDVSFRDDGSYVEAHSGQTDQSTGFYDLDLDGSNLGDGNFVYLYVQGQNTSNYVNFSSGSSTVLNHAGSYSSKCDSDGGGGDGGTTLSADFSYEYLSDYVVRFDGGNSGPNVQEYRWDWDADGIYENTTSDATFSHDYNENLSQSFDVELQVYNGTVTATHSESVEIPQSSEEEDTSGGNTGGGGSSGGGSSGGSDSGGGGLPGGGGGLLPSDEPPEEKVVSEEPGDDSSIGVGSVEENQPVQVNVEGESTITGVSFTAGSSSENVTVRVESAESPPSGVDSFSGGPAYRYYSVELQNLESFSEGSVGFKVPKSWLNSQDRSVNDVVLKSYDGFSWHRIDSSVAGETLDSYSLSADTSVMGAFAAGLTEEQTVVESPDIQVSEFNLTSEGKREVDVEVQAVARNSGNAEGEKTIYLYKDSSIVDNRTVSLAPGETKSLSFELTLSESGSHTIELGSYREDVSVGSGPGMMIFLVAGSVLLVVALLIGVIYYRETKRANELEQKISNIGEQGNQRMQNFQGNSNNSRNSMRGGNQRNQNRQRQGGQQNQQGQNRQRQGGQQNQQGQNRRRGNNQGQGSQNNQNQANGRGNQQGGYGNQDDGR
jgi:PGF-pre-PGF domain-containing protein